MDLIVVWIKAGWQGHFKQPDDEIWKLSETQPNMKYRRRIEGGQKKDKRRIERERARMMIEEG